MQVEICTCLTDEELTQFFGRPRTKEVVLRVWDHVPYCESCRRRYGAAMNADPHYRQFWHDLLYAPLEEEV